MTTVNINEAPKEPKAVADTGNGSFLPNLSKAESDSITTVALGLGAIVGGYLAFNYLDSQGYIQQILDKIGIGGSSSPTSTIPSGASGGAISDVSYSYPAVSMMPRQIMRTDYAKYSPDLTDISGDVEYKLHGDDNNLGAIEDPDDQYYYETKGFGTAYKATLEHDVTTDIQNSFVGQDDGVLGLGVGDVENLISYEGTTAAEDDGNISYVGEELIPADLSKYHVDRDNQGNLIDVSVDQ